MHNFIKYILLCALTLIGPAAFGQEKPAETKTETPKEITPTKDLPPGFLEELEKEEQQQDTHFIREFMNMLFVLGAMIAVLMLLTWFTKRMVHGRVSQLNMASPIKILDRRALSNKSMIYIVDIAGKTVALAESQNGVTFLAEVPHEHPSFAKYLGEKPSK